MALNKTPKPTVQLVSPDGEVVDATLLNARDLVQRGYLSKTAVDAAMKAQENGNIVSADTVAAKMLAKKKEAQKEDEVTVQKEKKEEKTEEPWSLEGERVANGFTTQDDYLESLKEEQLRTIITDRFNSTVHHKSNKTSMITKIKELATAV